MATLTSFAEKNLKDKVMCFWGSANDEKRLLLLSDIGIEKKITKYCAFKMIEFRTSIDVSRESSYMHLCKKLNF